MVSVDLDKIITAQALKEHLERILFEVEDGEQLFVITKKGRPRAALVNVDYLEEITGRSVQNESREYDRYETSPAESADKKPADEIWPTAGLAEARSNDKDTIAPSSINAPAPNSPELPTPANPAPATVTEPAEPEPELDLPELSIDDLAFDDEPAAIEQSSPPPSVETPDAATAPTPTPTPAPIAPAEPANQGAVEPTVPSLGALLEDPNAAQNDAISLSVPEQPTESPEDWARSQMPVPPATAEDIKKETSTQVPTSP